MSLFKNRAEAGKELAKLIKKVSKSTIVLAVPRGGVVVGYEVAKKLKVPLDIIATKKIGAPANPELAIGAVAEDGTYIIDEQIAQQVYVPKGYIEEEVKRMKEEIQRRLVRYRGEVPYPELESRDVVVIDDGVATGSTLKAALRLLRRRRARSITVGVPVGPPDTIVELEKLADRVVCLHTPSMFYAIGQFYEDFSQTSDEEVAELLRQSREYILKREGPD
jgi:putative phosphoribosyl transferase